MRNRDPVAKKGAAGRPRRNMPKSQGPHDWLIHVLDDLALYATEHGLPRIAHALENARKGLDLSSRHGTRAAARTVERAWFIDTLRDLIDFANQNGLTEAERHLLRSLELAPREWERAERVRVDLPHGTPEDEVQDSDGTHG
jgi:hypothetical protein